MSIFAGCCTEHISDPKASFSRLSSLTHISARERMRLSIPTRFSVGGTEENHENGSGMTFLLPGLLGKRRVRNTPTARLVSGLNADRSSEGGCIASVASSATSGIVRVLKRGACHQNFYCKIVYYLAGINIVYNWLFNPVKIFTVPVS